MIKFLLTCCITLFFIPAKADYVCFLLLNEEIKNTMEENEEQKKMQQKQLINLSAENVNKQQWDEFQDVSTKIRSRLNSVSLAIQAIPTANNIVRDIQSIYAIQSNIYEELSDAPQFIIVAINGQYEFADHLQMNIRLMAGLVLSYGAVNQLEKKERKILLDYAGSEMRALRHEASGILRKIRNAKYAWQLKKNVLQGWISQDKQIFRDILRNTQNL